MDIVQFVDSITASPTVRLDLNDGVTWGLNYERTDFSPPPLDASWAGTKLADGEIQVAAKYSNRRITLDLDLISTGPDGVAGELQKLWRELDRPFNFLRWQPQGATNPVFFRTFRSGSNSVQDYPGPGRLRTVLVGIDAKDTAFGLKETLPAVTVYNDPAEGTTLNLNPYFETDVSNWTVSGGTFVRSTAQFHEGTASGLLTPDGVSASVSVISEKEPATVGLSYRVSAWVYCAVARSVNIQLQWYDAGGGALSLSSTSVSVSAATWTLLDATFTAPASTAQAAIRISMGSTPLASHLLYIDEARLRQSGGVGGMCFDLSGVKGDVETPLFLSISAPEGGGGPGAGRKQSLISVRRRGTPANVPFVMQAESMLLDTDTTVQANDLAMSGAGSNFTRTTFATVTTMADRLHAAPTLAANVDIRGTYRVFARIRKTVAGDTIQMRMRVIVGGTVIAGDTYTLPSDTAIRWQDLGRVQFPLGADPQVDGYSGTQLSVKAAIIYLQAARTGTGNLDIDVVVLAPADDRLCFIKRVEDPGPNAFYIVDSGADQVYTVDTQGIVRVTEIVEVTGGFPMISPAVTNRVYFADDVGSSTTAGDSITRFTQITPYYWPRYLAAKPATT